MDRCNIEECGNELIGSAYMDAVVHERVFRVGPMRVCQEHADALGQSLTEIQYDDGRFEQRRNPGEPRSDTAPAN